MGPVGLIGPKGDQGIKGEKGPVGIQGEKVRIARFCYIHLSRTFRRERKAFKAYKDP
jgi:hypothetical protein